MDDEDLLDDARRGSRDAFDRLVIRHQDEIYTMALRMLGRPADAADVTQETFLRAFLNLPTLRRQTFRAWLYRVAINAAHDVQRQGRRRPAQPLHDDAGNVVDLPDPAASPEERTERRDQGRRVREALLRLPDEFRAAVILRDVNELSYEEIAAALRTPLGTVKSRIARGRTLLAGMLREQGAAAEGGA